MAKEVKGSSYWDKRAIERLTDAEKTSEEYITRIKKMYDRAYKNIDREIANVYKNYSKATGLDVQKLKELLTKSETKKTWEEMKTLGLDDYVKDNYKSRISRLEQIQAQIYSKAKEVYPEEEMVSKECYKNIINNSYYKNIYDTQMGTGYDFSFSKIDENLVTALLSERWSGKNYSERIWGNTDILADSVSELVGGALLSGQSIEKTSKQIRDRFGVSKYYAERLVRTETNHFHGEADMMAYKEMGVEYYIFTAVLDSRTSQICQELDGQKFKVKEAQVGVNQNPMHPNCRSTTRAYLGEEAEKNLERRARNPITGKTEIIPNMTYKEWIKQYNIGLGSNGKYTFEQHPSPKLLETIEVNEKNINDTLKKYEKKIKDAKIENAIVITKKGEVYQCFGNKTNVWPDVDLGNKLFGASVTHNHIKDKTSYSFSTADVEMFKNYNLSVLRGIDTKYTYELNKNKKNTSVMPNFGDIIEDNSIYHLKSIDYAIKNDVSYKRWNNG